MLPNNRIKLLTPKRSRLKFLQTGLALATLLLGSTYFAFSATAGEPIKPDPPKKELKEFLTKAPKSLTKHVAARFEGPFRIQNNRIADRPPSCIIVPDEFEDQTLPPGVLTVLKKYPEVTGLRLYAGPMMSSASSDSHSIDFTPGSIADIGELTHLERLDISAIDLTRGAGLEFLEHLPNLRELSIDNCKVEFQDVLAHLPPAKHLRSIFVRYRPKMKEKQHDPLPRRRIVPYALVEKLVENSQQLEHISVTSHEQYEPESLKKFVKLPKLKRFSINYAYPKWFDAKRHRDVKDKTPTHDAHQEAEGKTLEKQLESKGISKYRGSHMRLEKMYYLPYHMIQPSDQK